MLKGMKKYKIRKVMVTIIDGWRHSLITKEKMENFCKGKETGKKSVNDDLEKFFEDIRLGSELNFELNVTYYLPKLTKEELDLVEKKDYDFMNTFSRGMDADVDKAEMMLSESDSKFVHGYCWRKTYTIENSWSDESFDESIENEPQKKQAQSWKQKIYNYCSLQ